jgi:hypothetical protein
MLLMDSYTRILSDNLISVASTPLWKAPLAVPRLIIPPFPHVPMMMVPTKSAGLRQCVKVVNCWMQWLATRNGRVTGSKYLRRAESPNFKTTVKSILILRNNAYADMPLSALLEKWGYGSAAWDDYYDLDVSLPIKRALTGLGVDTKTLQEGGKNRCMQLEHEHEVTVDGATYGPTTAYFTTVFNPEEGVIVAWGSYGAKYMGSKQTPPITLLPKIQNWSDIVWLQWAHMAGEAAENIRYIFRSPVANTDAQWLISRALQQSKKELSAWPGVEYSMETGEGKAILSSPNGAGVAYLLFTHKRKLGRKTISKVTVFADDGKMQSRPPSLIYHVVDAPPLQSERDKHSIKRSSGAVLMLARYFTN